MTLYYLVSRKRPLPTEQLHGNWIENLRKAVAGRKCAEWRSLPNRVARLIDWATKSEQNRRWDMTRIHGELSRLNECLRRPLRVESMELFCEEIAARCESMRDYLWDVDKTSAHVELKSGFTVRLESDQEKSQLLTRIEWLHMGDRPFKDVKRFVGTAADKVCARLKTGGWRIEGKQVTFDRVRIEGSIGQKSLSNERELQLAATAVSAAIDILRFD
jgi:hypothetical protein